MLLKGDRLSDGSTIAALHREGGQTYADLDDGRQIVLPDRYVLNVYRPTPDKPVKAAESPSKLFN